MSAVNRTSSANLTSQNTAMILEMEAEMEKFKKLAAKEAALDKQMMALITQLMNLIGPLTSQGGSPPPEQVSEINGLMGQLNALMQQSDDLEKETAAALSQATTGSGTGPTQSADSQLRAFLAHLKDEETKLHAALKSIEDSVHKLFSAAADSSPTVLHIEQALAH